MDWLALVGGFLVGLFIYLFGYANGVRSEARRIDRYRTQNRSN